MLYVISKKTQSTLSKTNTSRNATVSVFMRDAAQKDRGPLGTRTIIETTFHAYKSFRFSFHMKLSFCDGISFQYHVNWKRTLFRIENRKSCLSSGVSGAYGRDPFNQNSATGPTGKSGPPQKADPFSRNFSGWTEPIH